MRSSNSQRRRRDSGTANFRPEQAGRGFQPLPRASRRPQTWAAQSRMWRRKASARLMLRCPALWARRLLILPRRPTRATKKRASSFWTSLLQLHQREKAARRSPFYNNSWNRCCLERRPPRCRAVQSGICQRRTRQQLRMPFSRFSTLPKLLRRRAGRLPRKQPLRFRQQGSPWRTRCLLTPARAPRRKRNWIRADLTRCRPGKNFRLRGRANCVRVRTMPLLPGPARPTRFCGLERWQPGSWQPQESRGIRGVRRRRRWTGLQRQQEQQQGAIKGPLARFRQDRFPDRTGQRHPWNTLKRLSPEHP